MCACVCVYVDGREIYIHKRGEKTSRPLLISGLFASSRRERGGWQAGGFTSVLALTRCRRYAFVEGA